MDLATYQKCAERTMNPDQSTADMTINSALGMCGEAAEIANAVYVELLNDVLEECGDLMWYAAQHCNAMGISLAEFAPRTKIGMPCTCLDWLWSATGELADMTKKEYFHKKDVNAVDRWMLLDTTLSAVSTLLGFYGFTLSDACEHNNAKLLIRHKDGWTPEGANAYADKKGI